MNLSILSSSGVRRTLVSLAAAAACSGAYALPTFALNPGAGAVPGAPTGSFSADNIIISDYSTVLFGAGNSFTDSGYLGIQSFQLGGNVVSTPGLNGAYSLYFAFNGAGTVSGGNPAMNVTNGSFTSLDFTLFGAGGQATFGSSGDTTTVSTAGAPIVLATGSLVPGASQSSVGSSPQTPSFNSFASANETFNVTDVSFFASPASFYNFAVSSFINSPDEISAVAAGYGSGFKIAQGGGSVNFVAAPVPEPETYALLLAGLGVMGILARRRRRVD